MIKSYLVLYNLLSTLGWGLILVRTLTVVLNLDGSPLRPASLVQRAAGAYAEVGADTAFVQSFAALEVLHVLLDRKSTRLNSSHSGESRMPSSA